MSGVDLATFETSVVVEEVGPFAIGELGSRRDGCGRFGFRLGTSSGGGFGFVFVVDTGGYVASFAFSSFFQLSADFVVDVDHLSKGGYGGDTSNGVEIDVGVDTDAEFFFSLCIRWTITGELCVN